MRNTFYFILISLFLYNCSATPIGYKKIDENDLSEKIDLIIEDSLFSHAHWGVYIESLETGRIIYERNADRMFMPASNEKILTSAAALTVLGSDYQIKTYLNHTGYILDSTLYGDIIVLGNGDPNFSDYVFDKATSVFELWADSLKSLGIDTIHGNIIGDDNNFDNESFGYGWTFDDFDYWYSAEIGALQLNENYIDLKFIPPISAEDTLQIIPDVESNYYKLIKDISIVDTGKTRLQISSEYGQNNILIKGEILRGSEPFERSPTITNSTKFFVTVLKEVFERKGIAVLGNSLDCDEIINYQNKIDSVKTLIVHTSPPLKEMLKVLMKRSQNLYAETMVRILGFNKYGLGTFENGKKVVEEVLTDFGIEKNSYAYKDGSGLARYNFISPKQIVKILKAMRKSIYWETWYNILPIAGVDGTLKRRMIGTKAQNNVRAKTGTLSNVRALSGYVTTSSGEEIVFSFLLNGHLRTSKETELITDKVLELIAAYPFIKNVYFENY